MKKYLKLAVSMALAAGSITAAHATSLQESVQSEVRSNKNKARDEFRNPQQTLNFFGLKDDMTVVEIWPGGGWYTELIAPVVADKGKFVAAHFPTGTDIDYFNKNLPKYQAKIKNTPALSKTQITEFHPKFSPDMAPANSADMVVTFRNLHNFYMTSDELMHKTLAAAFKALKPGGVLGVVDHKLPEELDAEKFRNSGYMKQSIVESAAKKAGFELVASSHINSNPLDLAQYERGVWTLPPTLALGDKDKGKYIAIGESNRFTLKFVKPKL